MHELKIIEIELTFVYELYRGVQASLLFNGEELRYVEIKAQTFLIWFLILIYGWWPWLLMLSTSGKSSMKLWVFSSCGAGSTGWMCSQYKVGLGGWELNVLHKGSIVSWWQRTITALGPTSSFSFALPRMHRGRDYQGGNCWSMKLCCFVCSALVCSSKALCADFSSRTKVPQAHSSAGIRLVATELCPWLSRRRREGKAAVSCSEQQQLCWSQADLQTSLRSEEWHAIAILMCCKVNANSYLPKQHNPP